MLYTALLVIESPGSAGARSDAQHRGGSIDPADSPTRVHAALAEVGCDLACASSLPHAHALLARRSAPDLVVIDVADPITMCERLGARTRHVPILAIVEPDQLAATLEVGADDCIARTASHAELVARARALLRAGSERVRHARRERRLTEELHKVQREKHALERIACVDSLTGVANRRHALALLEAEWKRSARDGTPISLVMVDLDCFHAYNESYGHVGGDACLRRACAAMVASLRRPSDFLGRYGGEEFIAVLANTDSTGAALVAERLRASVEALALPHEASACARVVTISVGFATCQARPEMVVADLLSKADHALLTAKAHGRNRVVGDAPPVVPRTPVSPQAWTRFPIVIADPWFADRIPGFLEARREDARAIAAGCEIGAFDRIRGLARRMKGAAIEHGFDHILGLAFELDQAARDEDRAAIRCAVDELVQYVDHVQVTYRRPLDQTA